jgi:small subunit ribosomal protein S2
VITLKQMIRSGVHLGHQVRKWNPKMKTFIYIEKDGHHIIDLILTQLYLDKVTKFLFKAGKKKKTVLFVGVRVGAGIFIF